MSVPLRLVSTWPWTLKAQSQGRLEPGAQIISPALPRSEAHAAAPLRPAAAQGARPHPHFPGRENICRVAPHRPRGKLRGRPHPGAGQGRRLSGCPWAAVEGRPALPRLHGLEKLCDQNRKGRLGRLREELLMTAGTTEPPFALLP